MAFQKKEKRKEKINIQEKERRNGNPYYWTVQIKRPSGQFEKGYVLGTANGGESFLIGYGTQRKYDRYENVNDFQISKWQAEEFDQVTVSSFEALK